MHLETVLSQLKSMRLSAMATALETRLKANDHAGLSHEEFIALLVQDEWEARENRKLTRMISRANFKPEQRVWKIFATMIHADSRNLRSLSFEQKPGLRTPEI